MLKYILLFLTLNLGFNCVRETCMIEVIQRHTRYKAIKYSGVSEERIMESFKIFSENGNLAQQELIQALILNFDLLDEVTKDFIYNLGISSKIAYTH